MTATGRRVRARFATVSRRAAAAGSQSSLREANRNLVVETVKRYGGLTQVELAEATGLSQATVSTIVRELLAAGVVDTATTTRSGRRAQMVTLARRVGLAAGVQIGHRHLRLVLGDFSHQVIAEQTLPLPAEHRVDTSLDRVALLVVDLLERVGASLDDVVGLGVGLPAPVDTSTGHGLGARHHARLGQRARRPGAVQAAGPAGVRGQRRQPRGDRREHARRVARQYSDSVFVRASYGTGAGIVINGQVHRGVAGTAGEIGHVQVAFPGETVPVRQPRLPRHRRRRGGPDRAAAGEPRRRWRCATWCSARSTATSAAARWSRTPGAMIGAVVAGLGDRGQPAGASSWAASSRRPGSCCCGPLREAVRRRVLLNQIAPLEVVAATLGSRARGHRRADAWPCSRRTCRCGSTTTPRWRSETAS